LPSIAVKFISVGWPLRHPSLSIAINYPLPLMSRSPRSSTSRHHAVHYRRVHSR
jgi:hypothetical protein